MKQHQSNPYEQRREAYALAPYAISDAAHVLVMDRARKKLQKHESRTHPEKRSPVESIQTILLGGSDVRQCWLLHRTDAVITDGESVLLVPAVGKQGEWQLPGGPARREQLTDSVRLQPCEAPKRTALRSVNNQLRIDIRDEAAVSWDFQPRILPNRIHEARSDALKEIYGIKKGDLVVESAQTSGLYVARPLAEVMEECGAQAAEYRIVAHERAGQRSVCPSGAKSTGKPQKISRASSAT
jgi:hypothetical protein